MMGKIVSIGGGNYRNGEITSIFEQIVSLSGKENPKVIFLPTAGFDDINGDEPIKDSFEKLGCTFDFLFLTDEKLTRSDIESAIFGADIIYVGGGNLEFLMNTLKSTGADDVLRQAYNRGKVMSGYSAGAICWFNSGYDDCGEDHAFVFVECLSILPYCYCPHFVSEHWRSFEQAVKVRDESGLGVEDGAAIMYIDGKFSTTRGNDGGDVFFFDVSKGHEKVNITDTPEVMKDWENINK